MPQFALSSELFAVLDQRSLRDHSGLILQPKGDDVQTVRVHYDTIAAETARISMITFDIGAPIGLCEKCVRRRVQDETSRISPTGQASTKKEIGRMSWGKGLESRDISALAYV